MLFTSIANGVIEVWPSWSPNVLEPLLGAIKQVFGERF